jgi:hypothetical protein
VVYYVQVAPELSAETDEPLIPDEFQEVLIDGVMAWYYNHIADDTARGSVSTQDFEFWLKRMMDEQEEYQNTDLELQPDDSIYRGKLRAAMADRINEATLQVARDQL